MCSVEILVPLPAPTNKHTKLFQILCFVDFSPNRKNDIQKIWNHGKFSTIHTSHIRYYVNKPARLISLAPVSLEAVQSSTHLVRALGAPLLVFHHHQAAPLLCMETNTVLFSLRIITTTEPWQMISS
jgi:hypothetical protein